MCAQRLHFFFVFFEEKTGVFVGVQVVVVVFFLPKESVLFVCLVVCVCGWLVCVCSCSFCWELFFSGVLSITFLNHFSKKVCLKKVRSKKFIEKSD